MADRAAVINIESVVREAVRHEFEARGLRKNGETWKAYVTRQVTPERICLVALLLFNFGGAAHDAQQQLKVSTEQAQAASANAASASEKADRAAVSLEATRQQLDRMTADLKQQAEANRDLKDRVAMSVTRAEFTAALAQQVLPRLERIERRLWDTKP